MHEATQKKEKQRANEKKNQWRINAFAFLVWFFLSRYSHDVPSIYHQSNDQKYAFGRWHRSNRLQENHSSRMTIPAPILFDMVWNKSLEWTEPFLDNPDGVDEEPMILLLKMTLHDRSIDQKMVDSWFFHKWSTSCRKSSSFLTWRGFNSIQMMNDSMLYWSRPNNIERTGRIFTQKPVSFIPSLPSWR